MTGVSIEAPLGLWASSLREVGFIAARGRGADAAVVQPGAGCGIGAQLLGPLGDERGKTGWTGFSKQGKASCGAAR